MGSSTGPDKIKYTGTQIKKKDTANRQRWMYNDFCRDVLLSDADQSEGDRPNLRFRDDNINDWVIDGGPSQIYPLPGRGGGSRNRG